MNSLPKTVTRQRRDYDLNPGPSAPESSTLTTRLPSHPQGRTAKFDATRNSEKESNAMLLHGNRTVCARPPTKVDRLVRFAQRGYMNIASDAGSGLRYRTCLHARNMLTFTR